MTDRTEKLLSGLENITENIFESLLLMAEAKDNPDKDVIAKSCELFGKIRYDLSKLRPTNIDFSDLMNQYSELFSSNKSIN